VGSSPAKPKQRVRAELLNTRTASIDTNALTTFTLLLEIRTQRYMWSLYKIGCIAKSSQQRSCYWWQNIHYHLTNLLLRSEIPSGICAKLRTVAASNNRVHMPWSLSTYASHHFQSLTSLVSPEITRRDHSIIACLRHIYVWCCSSRTSRSWWITQRNTTGEVATTSPPFYKKLHRSHVHCVKAELRTTFTSWSQHQCCCDRKYRAAYAQSFTPWQQATIEFTCHDHSPPMLVIMFNRWHR